MLQTTPTRRRWPRALSILLSAALAITMLAPVAATAQEDDAPDPTNPDNYEATRLTQPNTEGELDQVGELHGLSIADDGRVFYIGRGGGIEPITDWSDPDVGSGAGTVHMWDPATEEVTLAGTLDVFGNRGGDGVDRSEEGLVGIALDPDFLDNGWIYLHYTPHEKLDADARRAVRQVSRFTFDHEAAALDLDSEQVLLEWEVQVERCCHAGGDLKFDTQGNLYIATGDTNSSEFTAIRTWRRSRKRLPTPRPWDRTTSAGVALRARSTPTTRRLTLPSCSTRSETWPSKVACRWHHRPQPPTGIPDRQRTSRDRRTTVRVGVARRAHRSGARQLPGRHVVDRECRPLRRGPARRPRRSDSDAPRQGRHGS